MPKLDVSFITRDPMFADTFDVIRVTEAIGTNGRVVSTEQAFRGITGTVTQQDPSDLMKRDDGQFVPRSIFIATSFPIQAAVTGRQPDFIEWHSARYQVQQVYSYSRFGKGFYEVVAKSLDAVDPAQ